MNKEILHLAGLLLEHASSDFSTHGCNDIPSKFYDGWPDSKKEWLSKAYHQWNEGSLAPLGYEPGQLNIIPDYALMSFISAMLKYIPI